MFLFRTLVWGFVLATGAACLAQQNAVVLRGEVTDETGAVIPAAQVEVFNDSGFSRSTLTNQEGAWTLSGIAPGPYTVRVTAPGFGSREQKIDAAGGPSQPIRVALTLAVQKQEVTVQGEAGASVSTDPSSNAASLVLRGRDLDALSDDPDDLAADLQALAGPAAGPNGGEIFVDGFSGADLPPKSSIREVRVNQNPFSSQYDRLGFGRVEVFTKPGTDRFRGQAFFNFSDEALNSRNPFAPDKPLFQSRFYGINLSGSLSKRASLSLDAERRSIDDNAIINATLLDPSLNPFQFQRALVTPNQRTEITPRLDYQLSTNHTLTARYTFRKSRRDGEGIGQFALSSRGFNERENRHTLQLTETAVLSPRAINETRFQFIRDHDSQLGDNSLPAINVLQAFSGGGAQVGRSDNLENRWELHNMTSLALGAHGLKYGVRLRGIRNSDYSPRNFGGTFTFGGGVAPVLDANNQVVLDPGGNPVIGAISSLERYRRTLLFQQQGLGFDQIRALGGGPTQFSITGGEALANVRQYDVGFFVEDDWKARQNLTVSLGLRYEAQTNIRSKADFAPRIGIAWAPGTRGNRTGKTVIRSGFGIFYDRFQDDLVLEARRFNGISQQQYIINDPNFFPDVPPVSTLATNLQPQTVQRISPDLRAPYVIQTAVGIERQLPFNTTISSTFAYSRGVHLLRTRNINAPLPGTFDPLVPGSGVRPYGPGNIYDYESTGILKQKQLITNVNSRVSRGLSLFAFYVLNYANSNTDGENTFPANQYDMSTEYGRAAFDTRHRVFVGGALTAFGLRLSPFLVANSGRPFNITTGRDNLGNTVFTERPAFATDLTKPGVLVTPFGAFDPNPAPGQPLVPRNYADGPGNFTLNLRVSRTFGFGSVRGGGGGGGGASSGGGGGRRRGGPGLFSGGGGFRSIFSDTPTESRYNVTLAISARNILNHVNLANPVGNLTSPLFGQSTQTAGGFGPGGNLANNRRIDLQLRFSF